MNKVISHSLFESVVAAAAAFPIVFADVFLELFLLWELYFILNLNR